MSFDRAINGLAVKVHKNTLMTAVAADVNRSTLVGRIAKQTVDLHRARPLVGNVFKPHFYGRFSTRDGKVSLDGQFSMSAFAKAIIVCFILCLFLAEVIMLPLIFESMDEASFLLWPPAVGVLLICIVLFAKWICRNDPKWISETISKVFNNS
jgi:hypothetical protein